MPTATAPPVLSPEAAIHSTEEADRVPQERRAERERDVLQEAPELEPPAWLVQLCDERARFQDGGLPTTTRWMKRGLDITVAAGLLIAALPIMVIAAIAIKATSPGPVIFRQIRVGLNRRRHDRSGQNVVRVCRRKKANFGRPFVIYKLRTMHVAADGDGPRTAQKDDQRVFGVGRFLRQTRIDELPQLINVLKGEMSMVGPRPECIDYMEDLTKKFPDYAERLRLKPGLTGIAQIEAGYANDLDSYRRKLAFDLMYLRNCSVRNDLKIMLRTGRVMLTGFGAL